MTARRPSEYARSAGLASGIVIVLALIFFNRALLIEGLAAFWYARAGNAAAVVAAATTTPPVVREVVRTRPLAIMVDNHPDARPQSGVSKADFVWEVPVEGGLTRDMLIFRGSVADEIGPVRSARPYFLRLARESDAVYAHVGGSDAALKELASGALGLDNADEFSTGSAFARDSRRSAPHNAYTSSEKLKALIAKKDWPETTDAVDATLRGTTSETGTPATRIKVTAIGGGEEVEFAWDGAAGTYGLLRSGRVARDRDGSVIAPHTVVAIEMTIGKIDDPQGKGLIGVETVGSGKATVFRDGAALEGTWKKTSALDPLRVFDASGAQMPFADGQVWYAVIGGNRGGEVSFTP